MHVSAEEQATAAWIIFNRHFFVRVQNKFLYSDAFLQHKGIISMTPQDAEAEMNSFRLTAMTIAELVTLRMNGALIQFTEVTDSVTVYNLIIQHLNDWAEIARGGIFDTMPPAEELFIIDEMAAELHPYVVRAQMRQLNNGRDTRGLGDAFFGKSAPQVTYTTDKANRYKNIAPLIIDRARTYYGNQEFFIE